MAPKNDRRAKRSSSKPRRRREEQLDLFPQDLKLAPSTAQHGGVRRVPRNEREQRGAAGAPTRLFLL